MAIPKIREQIEARVQDTGDTMTDNLIIKRNTYPGVALDALSTGTRTSLQAWDNSAVLVNFNVSGNTDNRRAIFIKNSSTATQVKNALTLRDWVNGTSTDYKIYGEHNKPTPADIGAATASHVHDQYYTSDINRTANTVLAAPNGSAGSASFRKLVAADIPDLSGTYLKLSGGTMTGPIGMNVGTGLSMAYESGKDTPWIYPKGATGYGIRYLEGTPDKMMISASGNNTTAGGADLCINGNGEGTVTIRGNTILHAGNYNSYSPTKTGGGASGTWPISISGNASTANSSSNSSKLNGLSDTAFKRTWSAYAGKDYVGWLKLIEWKVDTAGHFNPQPFIFEICRNYNSPSPESYIIAFTSSWGSGELVQLNGAIGHRIIEQFRISCDSSRTTYWFEMYVNTSYTTYQNGCGCSVFGYYSFDGTLLESIKQTASVSTVISLTTGRGIISIAGTDYTTYRTRNIASNTGALTSGSTALASGYIYLQYK